MWDTSTSLPLISVFDVFAGTGKWASLLRTKLGKLLTLAAGAGAKAEAEATREREAAAAIFMVDIQELLWNSRSKMARRWFSSSVKTTHVEVSKTEDMSRMLLSWSQIFQSAQSWIEDSFLSYSSTNIRTKNGISCTTRFEFWFGSQSDTYVGF